MLLPCGLVSLSFGVRFNQSLKNVVLPSGLQHIKFGEDFNQSVETTLFPSGLVSVSIARGRRRAMAAMLHIFVGNGRLRFTDDAPVADPAAAEPCQEPTDTQSEMEY